MSEKVRSESYRHYARVGDDSVAERDFKVESADESLAKYIADNLRRTVMP